MVTWRATDADIAAQAVIIGNESSVNRRHYSRSIVAWRPRSAGHTQSDADAPWVKVVR
jgi:hypothetical protein